MDDERHNLPSASGASRLLNCPGSWRLEQQSPPSEDTEEATIGTRIHEWGAGLLTDDDLSMRELDTGRLCKQLESEALEAWNLRNENPALTVVERETVESRMWLRQGLRPVFSGLADVIAINGRRGLILDWKTGWGEQQESAENEQLRELAVLLHDQNPDLQEITVGIIQPAAGMSVQLATFQLSHLETAEHELRLALDFKDDPTAPHQMGPWCRYCRAKAICPQQQGNLAMVERLHIGTSADRQELLPTAQLGQLLNACSQAEKMIGDIRAEAKRRLAAGEAVEGWQLKDGVAKRKVTDNAALAIKLMTDMGVTAQTLLEECATIRVGDLDVVMRLKAKMTAKQVKEWQKENLADVIKAEAGGPQLERA